MWDERSILELAADEPYAVNGGPFGSKLGRKDYVDEGVPVIRGTNLPPDRRFSYEGFVFVSEAKAQELRANLARPRDVVVTQRGTIGQVGVIPLDSPHAEYVVSQSQMKVTVNQDLVDTDFIYYSLRSPDSVRRLQDLAMSAGVPHINLEMFRSFRLQVPPLSAQRKIAAVLVAYDELIENYLRQIEILEEMAQSVYREWFVNFRFPGHEDVAMVDSTLGPIPEGWTAATLGDVAENFDRLRKPLSKMERSEMQGEYPYYGAAKVFDYVNDYIFDGEYLLIAEDGSVITPDGYPVLQLANGKFWANNHTHILQGSAVSTHYLYLALSPVRMGGYITGAAQPKITQGALKRIPIALPRQSTHDEFDRLTRPMFDLRCNLLDQNINLRATRDLLLPRLVSGELDVSELDIDTEWLAS